MLIKIKKAIKEVKQIVKGYDPYIHGMRQSSLEVYWQCPKKARYWFEGWRTSKISDAMIFGTIVHKGLEIIYTLIKNGTIHSSQEAEAYIKDNGFAMFDEVYKEYGAESNTQVTETINMQAAKALVVLPIYFSFYEADFKMNWKALEKSFKFDLGGMPVTGIRDADLFKDNGLWLFETKTKSRYNIDSIMQWVKLQLQTNLYIWAQYEDYTVKAKGLIYNIIRNPAMKKKSSQSWEDYKSALDLEINYRPEFYFQRVERIMPFMDVDQYIANLKKELQRFITWFYTNKNYDMMYGSACESKYGKCPYIGMCLSDGRDTSLLEKIEYN